MEVAVKLALSDDALNHSTVEVSRLLLEEFAVQGYKSDQLTAGQVRRLLGFETPMEVDAFLKSRQAYFDYSDEQLVAEEVASESLRAQRNHA